MGANEFDSDATAEQTGSSDRDFDSGVEEQGELLGAVRAEQRLLAQGIESLETAVAEYAQAHSLIRERRVERAKNRSFSLEDSHQQHSDQAERNHTEPDEHRSPTVKPRETEKNQPERSRGFEL